MRRNTHGRPAAARHWRLGQARLADQGPAHLVEGARLRARACASGSGDGRHSQGRGDVAGCTRVRACRVESCVIPCCHVLCLVESCVIPCGDLGRVMRDSPDGRHTRGRGDVTSCTVHCCRTACTTHGVRWGPGKVPSLVRARTMPVGPSHLVRSSSRRT